MTRSISITFPDFTLTHDPVTGLTTTHYFSPRNCPCPVVPDDHIHATQLSTITGTNITAQQHRLEHELWHHLVGIHIYHLRSSPIIFREAHHISHPLPNPDPTTHTHEWLSPSHEEWLVAALTHHLHNDPSYDHGAYHYLTHERNINVENLLERARQFVTQFGYSTGDHK